MVNVTVKSDCSPATKETGYTSGLMALKPDGVIVTLEALRPIASDWNDGPFDVSSMAVVPSLRVVLKW